MKPRWEHNKKGGGTLGTGQYTTSSLAPLLDKQNGEGGTLRRVVIRNVDGNTGHGMKVTIDADPKAEIMPIEVMQIGTNKDYDIVFQPPLRFEDTVKVELTNYHHGKSWQFDESIVEYTFD